MRKLMILIIVVMLIPSYSFAREKGFRGEGGGPMKMFKEIGLDKDQIKKVKKLNLEKRKKMIRLRSEIELKRIDFHEELQKTNPDKKTLNKLIDEQVALVGKRHRIKLETRLEMLDILTPEQKEQLSERMSERLIDRGHRGWRYQENNDSNRGQHSQKDSVK